MQSLSRLQAILLGIFVTVIWSFSWVIIKVGLEDDIPPLTFAGLRYSIAAMFLLGFTLQSKSRRTQLLQINRGNLLRLLVLGFFYYTATQGSVFLSLSYLPAATYSLLLNFTSIVVMIGGIAFLREYPSRLQYIGLAIFLIGIILYFFPTSNPATVGLIIGIGSMLANAISSLLGRAFNSRADLNALQVTVISMSFGSILLLIIGVIHEGWHPISQEGWAMILWLALVHTALAFTLWNMTLKVISATESSLINSTMLVQTAVLAWIFLGEGLSERQILALVIATTGIVIFQLRKTRVAKRVSVDRD